MKTSFLFSISLLTSLLIQAQGQQDELIAYVRGQFITITDYSGIAIETQIMVEKEGEHILITFWEETDNGFLFRNVNWSGNVELELGSGKK